MEVIYHGLIASDLQQAIQYYESEGGSRLGDRFFEDVEDTVQKVISSPRRYPYIDDEFRRAQLTSFLYREHKSTIQFLVLRHDKRHTNFGLRRNF